MEVCSLRTHTILDAQIITDYKLRNCKFNCALNISCQKTKYQPVADKLRVYKVRVNLWILYFFNDITTFLGFKNLSPVGDNTEFRTLKKHVCHCRYIKSKGNNVKTQNSWISHETKALEAEVSMRHIPVSIS
jgi:hypothetical protein